MPLKDTAHWMSFSENDYKVAQHLYEAFYPMPCEIICYHCQQASEKAIKAVYIGYGLPGGIPKKHDLSFLLNQLRNHVPVSDELLEYADELTPYGVTVRYPSEIRIDERDTKEALKHTKAIMDWASTSIQALQNKSFDQ